MTLSTIIGSGTELSIADLETDIDQAGIRVVPSDEVILASVILAVNGTEFFFENSEPFEIAIGGTTADDFLLQSGELSITATAYSGAGGTGAIVDQRAVELTALNGIAEDGAIIQSEFDQTAEAKAEAEADVRRQGFWNQRRLKLIESSAHLVDCIMRRAGGDASVALRVSFV